MKLLFLGTGGSAGIPMIGCRCPVCLSVDPHNKRLRPSALLEIEGKKILIDVGPDFRTQALKHGIDHLDGVIVTHTHYDHIAGLDELRVFYLMNGKPMPLLVSKSTMEILERRYDYLFKERKKISLTAQLDYVVLPHDRGKIDFCGIPFSYMSYEQGGMIVNGFRYKDVAYISDIARYPETIFEDLAGVKTLVLSALKSDTSAMHLSFDEAIAFSGKVGALHTYFMHISHEVDHEKVSKLLPNNITLAYDGLSLEVEDG